VQRRRDKAAAVKQGFAPDVLVTDKLRSYGAAKSAMGLSARHEQGLRRHCQTKFYTAGLRAGTRWSSTVFAHELPPRSASFEAENGVYLFALTMANGLLMCRG
jgi:hypothetical protein